MPACASCGNETLASCSRCKKEYFCDKKCLETVWLTHKENCVKNVTLNDVKDNLIFTEYIKKHGSAWLKASEAISKGETKGKILLFKGDSFFIGKPEDFTKILVKDVYKRFTKAYGELQHSPGIDTLALLKGRSFVIIQV